MVRHNRRMEIRHFVAPLALAFAAALPAAAQDQPQTALPRVKLGAGMYQIDAQVAQGGVDDGRVDVRHVDEPRVDDRRVEASIAATMPPT